MNTGDGIHGASEAQLAFLLSARTGCLASVDARGHPHALPICFTVLNGRIYSPLDEKPKRVDDLTQLRRVRNILQNRFVCLVVDRYSEDWNQLAWLQVRAEADLIQPGEAEHAAAVDRLRERYSQYAAMALHERPMLRLTPSRIVSWGV